MKDLTQGSILKHLLNLSLPIGISILIQNLYFLIDLYFVSQLGPVALAGVSAAGNLTLLIVGMTQIIAVGTVSLIAQAIGKKDKADVDIIFNQALFIAGVLTVLVLLSGYYFAEHYLKLMSSDPLVVSDGKQYLHYYLPNLALQFMLVVMSSALRGAGIVKPAMVIQFISVFINIILTPILVAGWFTGHAMGVAGAGLASSIAMAAAVVLMFVYFLKVGQYFSFKKDLIMPASKPIKRILALGFPSGGEFFMLFFYMAIIYWAIKDFGSAAQAGFGLGSRLMQAVFMPAMAIAFALPALAGQNYGAKHYPRVRSTFQVAALVISVMMASFSLFCLLVPELLLKPFTRDAEVIKVASGFLQVISFNFVPAGLIFTCSGMFQGMGNTWPSLLSMSLRLVIFALPVFWLSQKASYPLEYIWYISITALVIQMFFSLYLLKLEFAKKLKPEDNDESAGESGDEVKEDSEQGAGEEIPAKGS
ncbi:MATE family efflux transporter [Thalassomonas haliotis]|uniref:Multidrug-efflux transporter n=1 Tax=Thalassomonas haliotis TaxID=485448 RepID=A0ABY7VGN1_9GAMM|nr:MATE family efflux transporter [Thalassomonas haliotis]WDE12688.1 MATE family efflux transporter [Thalassomonas haliotis]